MIPEGSPTPIFVTNVNDIHGDWLKFNWDIDASDGLDYCDGFTNAVDFTAADDGYYTLYLLVEDSEGVVVPVLQRIGSALTESLPATWRIAPWSRQICGSGSSCDSGATSARSSACVSNEASRARLQGRAVAHAHELGPGRLRPSMIARHSY